MPSAVMTTRRSSGRVSACDDKALKSSSHDPEKACPGLDPGWEFVFGQDHAKCKNCGRAICTMRPCFGVRDGSISGAQSKRPNNRGKNVQKWLFSLIISCLSYAFFALLRRNIIAFQAAKHPYFAAKSNHRCNAGFTRKSPVMFANLVR